MNRTMEAIVWAMNSRGLSLAAWKVIVMLARKVGRRGFDVWPAHKSLAEDCEISVSSVRRALAELEEGGWLEILPRVDAAGDRTSNLYRLQVRAKLSFPDESELEIAPDDEDDEPSIAAGGSVQFERTRSVQFEQTVRSDRADGLFTGEQGIIPEEPIPVEEKPPSPDGEAAPTSDLFGLPDSEPEPESLEDFVVRHWNTLKADEPRIADVDVLNPGRVKKIEARAAEIVRGRARKKIDVTPEMVWLEIFGAIRRSTFLCGRAPPGRGRTSPFKLTIDYVLRPPEFSKILEGAYDDDERYRDRTGFDSGNGRSYGPAEEAIRSSLDGLRAPGNGRADGGDPGGDYGGSARGAAGGVGRLSR